MRRLVDVLAALVLTAAPLQAQTVTDTPAASHGAIGSSFEASLLRDLPTSDNLFALIETAQPSIISDRFSHGGLFPGQPARLGGFLASWTQTLFRVDGVDITDPSGSGVPLLFPDLAWWQRVDVATGLMPADINATGLAIGLTPLAPTSVWTRHVVGSVSHGALTGHPPDTAAPAIVRPDSWDRVSVIASGPVTDRLGAVFGGAWTQGSQFFRRDNESATTRSGSVFTNLVFSATNDSQLRAIGWFHRTESPFEQRVPFDSLGAQTRDTSLHAQTVWERRSARGLPTRVFASYTRRAHSSDSSLVDAFPVVDRLLDGSMAALSAPLEHTVDRSSVGARLVPRESSASRHHIQGGVEVSRSGLSSTSYFTGSAGETVNRLPARLWVFSNGGNSSRHVTTLAGDVSDRIRVSDAMTVDAGVRLDMAVGSASGAAENVSWKTLLPRVSARWKLTERWRLSALAGYARTAYRLPLDLLATGDPAAPRADVFRWNGDAATPASELIARVGPGISADPAFSSIDPNLERPVSDEVVLGIQAWPHRTLRLSFIGVARRESRLIGLVNVGVPLSSYDVFTVPDGGLFGEIVPLPIYNRRPDTFGQDRYLLTNPDQQGDATFKGFEIGFTWLTTRFLIEGGLTASIAQGLAGNRGFRVDENDQSVIGELWINPNAATFADGRFFSDRAYTGKLVSVVKFPRDVRLGVIARYQDGQPFSRIRIVEELNQGTEGVHTFASGGSRFTFTGTLDVRLQKSFAVGGAKLDAILDVYNLPNMSLEVEEDVVTGPGFRTISAVQPPRSVHVGVRWAF